MEISQTGTHAVENQAPPLAPYNVFESDLPLREAVEREGGGWGIDRLRDTGELAGSPEAIAHSERAERNEPILRTHDRYGNRIDEVELDPSWHWCLRQAIEREIHSLPWRDPQPGGHAVRAALFFVWSQVNSGVMCPVSMTYSAIPALREEPDLAAEWEPRITRASYDEGALVGMAMTEKQGGSDVRANSTRAVQNGDAWEITGHKWFCSYPPCDLFLTLAQAPAGLSCFLIEGRDPGFRIQRLKDKLGTRSLPSSEVEFHARARPAGGRGGARHPDDHPDGQPHAARLPDRVGRRDALGRGAGGAPRAPPERVRQAALRPAADAERAGRPRDRVGGRDRGDDARGARLRRGRRAVPADRHGGDEALRLQARAGARRRGARVPGRQRLRRGVRHAAAAARLPAQLDLGGLGQRVRARRAARVRASEPEAPARVPRRVRAGRAARTRALDAHLDRIAAAPAAGPRVRGAHAWCPDLARRAPGEPARAERAGGGGGRVLRGSRLGAVGRAYGTLPPGVDTEAILARALPA